MILPDNDFLKIFKETPGAFSVAECIALINICGQAPEGLCAELGTHKAKSTLAEIYGLKNARDIFLVEPEFKNMDWCLVVSNTINRVKELSNNKITCTLISGYSTDFIPKFDRYAFVFVDSGVHDDLVMEECKLLEDRVIKNGIIAFHDKNSQFTAVDRAYDYLVSTGKYDEIDIDWTAILHFVKENNLEDGNDSWHQYPKLPHPPNFVGALKRK